MNQEYREIKAAPFYPGTDQEWSLYKCIGGVYDGRFYYTHQNMFAVLLAKYTDVDRVKNATQA